jgi:hypothetical protein
MAIVAGIVFSVVFLVFRLFLPTSVAVRCAIGFVMGAGAGAGLAGGLLALTMGTGTLQTGAEVLAYLATLAASAVLGGAVLSWQFARRFRSR